jgi:23S rRNA (cytidine1920-2'-O)/16S rRNA (cytidine1409-2'-O)-methyltransferase
MPRRRIDLLLVERGLFESRAKAQAAVEAGLVRANGTTVAKASSAVAVGAEIVARSPHPYVSRGGVKLFAALQSFGIDATGRLCLDVGASTGGFTDALLARGARHVYAVDVGHDQLHPKLRQNSRVSTFESTDIRKFDRALLPESPTLIVVDVSFISLKLVLPAALALAAPQADLVALIKPQFEAGRGDLKKGIVKAPAVHQAVTEDIAGFVGDLEWQVAGIIDSPITGGDGNREFLLGARRG